MAVVPPLASREGRPPCRPFLLPNRLHPSNPSPSVPSVVKPFAPLRQSTSKSSLIKVNQAIFKKSINPHSIRFLSFCIHLVGASLATAHLRFMLAEQGRRKRRPYDFSTSAPKLPVFPIPLHPCHPWLNPPRFRASARIPHSCDSWINLFAPRSLPQPPSRLSNLSRLSASVPFPLRSSVPLLRCSSAPLSLHIHHSP